MINKPEIKIKNKELQNKLNLFMHRYFGALVLVFVFIFLYLGFIYIIKPKNERVNINSQVMLVDKQSEKRMLTGALEKLIAYRLAYDNIAQTEKEKINTILPGKEGKENIFSNFEALILRQGLVLNSIDLKEKDTSSASSRQRQAEGDAGSVPAAGGVENISLTIEVGGVNSYDRFKEFLISIEKNMRLIDLTNISYDQSAGTIKLEALTYYMN